MASLRSAFQTSSKLESEGVYLEIGNTRIRLARAGGSNQAYNLAMTKVLKEHKRAIDLDLLSDDKGKELLFEVFAEHIVREWDTNVNDDKRDEWNKPLPVNWVAGIDDGKGGVIEPTHENVVATFREMFDLFIECKNFAENLQWYRQSILDGVTKN